MELFAVKKTIFTFVIALILSLFLVACGGGSSDSGGTNQTNNNQAQLENLGKSLYFDENLSQPAGQSCASCHLPEAGFADPDQLSPTSEGAGAGLFGNRNSPTASYAAHIPEFLLIKSATDPDKYIGGQFWDGRASTLEDQAAGPFLNPIEMNNADKAEVIGKVKISVYAADFETVFGAGALDDVETAYAQVTQAIAAFERTDVFSPFSSKFDAVQQGLESFNDSELRGQELFTQHCDVCHTSTGAKAMFTNFEYKNISTPANPNNLFLTMDASFNPDGMAFVDLGLGGVVGDPLQDGKFRTSTLRNIAETAPYMHNGVFDTLEKVVDFYFSASPPEVNRNISMEVTTRETFLAPDDKTALVDFMKTLSDR